MSNPYRYMYTIYTAELAADHCASHLLVSSHEWLRMHLYLVGSTRRGSGLDADFAM